MVTVIKVKVTHTRLPSVRFRSCSRFLAVSLHCDVSHKPDGRLPLLSVKKAAIIPVLLLGEVNRDTMGVNNLPKAVTQQRRDCDLNPGPS